MTRIWVAVRGKGHPKMKLATTMSAVAAMFVEIW